MTDVFFKKLLPKLESLILNVTFGFESYYLSSFTAINYHMGHMTKFSHQSCYYLAYPTPLMLFIYLCIVYIVCDNRGVR